MCGGGIMEKIHNEEFCKRLLYHSEIGTVLKKQHTERLAKIFKRHPHYKEKAGVGIHHVSVQVSCRPPAKCFVIHRIDGSVIDISYRKALGLKNGGSGCDIKNMVLV